MSLQAPDNCEKGSEEVTHSRARPESRRFSRSAQPVALRRLQLRGMQGLMSKGRLEAFSDGGFAILITLMVLDIKVPQGADVNALRPLIPVVSH